MSSRETRAVTETIAPERSTPSTLRVVAGLVAAAAMVVAACVCIGLMFAALFDRVDMNNVNEPGDGSLALALAIVALLTAVGLFAGTGPVAYLISRRRWTLALPLILLGIWGLGIAVAAWT
jgi:hypothetical protein